MTSEPIESAYISEALSGRQSGYKKLYESHVDGLFAFLNQFSDNREQTKEWTQKTFIKAFDKLDTFKQKSSFKSWLFAIGLNEMRMDLRKEIHFEELNPDEHTSLNESNIESPERWDFTKSAIRKLDPDKRIVLLLHVAEGYAHEEISRMLNLSEVSSRVTLHRAKKELKNQLHHE